jgi:cytoskeletal protein CcmA (bactofilin family)
MFRRRRDEPEETKAPEPTPVRAAAQPNLIPPAPSPSPPAERAPIPPATPVRPEAPRPMAATPVAPPKLPTTPAAASPPAEEGQRLIVGKGIVLNGEITACDRLVVEGKVQATLSKTRSIEISPTGVFKGAAEIEQATVAGLYDGKLTCKGKLTIRGSGRVQGEVRYGEIEIEVGGVISGNVGATAG